ncbi:hypothetical protein JMF97_16940 [Micromonospora fiedleri]|uniref:Uncharacterized protein n=1 Tax=Micromonospora fiedleri TaxID=1157498 RepID=A0ABS1UNE1_9ACTN|nr:hypothetical protein [Micromonospora fiedleri]MBL6277843.1 hypothetical protein [Micromonospora fiedleri]
MTADETRLAVELDFLSEDPTDRDIARSYWEVDADGSWKRPVREVTASAGISQITLTQRLREIAIARDPETPCENCGIAMIAASRSEFDQNRRSAAFTHVVCKKCRSAKEEAEKLAAAERQQRLVDEVNARFGYRDLDPLEIEQLSLREVVTLLALFRNPMDENYTCSIPLDSWSGSSPFSARPKDGRSRLTELWNSGKIYVHPSTPPKAFGWVVDSEGDEQPGVYVDRVRWTARGQGPTGSVNATLVKGIKGALARPWPDAWQMGWASEWDRVMLEEALAYLELCMEEYNFEFSPGDRTRDVLAEALESFALGAVYNFIWRATKDSAAYFQRGGVTRRQAANSTVGRIERSVEYALAQKWDVKIYRRDRRLPWSAVSTTLFTTVLGVGDAMTARPDDVPLDDSEDPAWEPDAANHEGADTADEESRQ